MPSFNFQKRFVPAVRLGLRKPKAKGAKRQTIRAKRKHRPRVGQTAFLKHGSRFKPKRIGSAVIVSVLDISIGTFGVIIENAKITRGLDLEKLAVLDGFKSWTEMLTFFRDAHGLSFRGDLIQW